MYFHEDLVQIDAFESEGGRPLEVNDDGRTVNPDGTVNIELDFTEQEIEEIQRMASERGMDFNTFIVYLLEKAMLNDELKKDNEEALALVTEFLEQHPYIRLGQLLSNIASIKEQDVFYLSNKSVISALKNKEL